jgi:hypothetical protein
MADNDRKLGFTLSFIVSHEQRSPGRGGLAIILCGGW